tara:strand:+ start:525 stop:734 length:210 start_codon:yes stop_codon:yes gene_type:complete
MNNDKVIENELIAKINKILNDFENFEQALIDENGNVTIKKKVNKKISKDVSILTHIFKEIIKKDEKNRV